MLAWKESILHPAYGPVLEGDVDDEKRNAPSWQLKLPVPVTSVGCGSHFADPTGFILSAFQVCCSLHVRPRVVITYLTLFVGKLW